ncbi:MAG: ABC transporter permease [Planctomycetes bacterium]|nr:ABC transporter permease [Planctomycetota bacterium]
MYKLLLSWRYLRTRYIALASIISVTLGVATLVIVNAVMAGFTAEANKRLNGILSDIVVESHSLNGFGNPEWHAAEIGKVVGEDLAGMTATVHVPAMLSIPIAESEYLTRQVNLIGVDVATYAEVGDFAKYLLHPANHDRLCFTLHEDGYAPNRADFPKAGWRYRRERVAYERAYRTQVEIERERARRAETGPAASAEVPADPYGTLVAPDPYGAQPAESVTQDPMTAQSVGVILGIAVCSQRVKDEDGVVRDFFFCRPGDDVKITLPTAGSPPKVISDVLTVVDMYESKMSEYDSTLAFMPLEQLQHLRGMIDPQSATRYVTSILIKLKPGTDLNAVRDRLQQRFPVRRYPYRIQTWRDMQGPLLAAVQLETTILNILLFLIIAVAGFGILATFYMIVVEKTRDVGILKALGAPSRGVMSIFLGYGFSLGLAGSGVGLVLGLLFVRYINQIAAGLEWVTGRPVFDPTVYYFQEIPAIVQTHTVVGVMVGAVLIAVLASVLPARHAAKLHPVEALRYE